MDFAIPTEGLESPQLVFLMAVYGYILATASNYLAEGAELLLEALGPSWAGVIGGCLVPLLVCFIVLIGQFEFVFLFWSFLGHHDD